MAQWVKSVTTKPKCFDLIPKHSKVGEERCLPKAALCTYAMAHSDPQIKCKFCLLLKSKDLNLVPLYCNSITQD